MDRESLRRFFDKFNPEAKGKVSRSEIFATFRTRTGANLTDTMTSDVFTEGGENDDIVDRRRSGLNRMLLGKPDGASNSAVGEKRSACTSEAGQAIGTNKTPTARKSRNGPRIGKSDDLIDFDDLFAAVEKAQDPRAINDEDTFDEPMEEGDISQVEARTPPAMERNLFLSALANGKLAYHRDDLLVTLKRIIAGGLAGMMAKSVVAPVDRVKILFQVTNEKFSFRKATGIMQNIVTLEGPAGLWKGNSATMIRVFPYAGTQFMIFDTVKRWLLLRRSRGDPSAPQRLSNFESLMSGSIAGAISALVTYPLDMARTRLAVSRTETVHGRRRSMGVWEVLRSVVREEGFRALYRGVTPSLLGIMPYAGIAFSINEHAKYEMIVLTGREPGTLHKLGIGAFAGLVAQSCTYPLEVVRRRMQTHGMVDTHAGVRKALEVGKGSAINRSHLVHTSFLQTLTMICREQGVRGLFKGLSVNWVKGPVAISISFTTFDFLKRRLDIS